MCYTNSNMEIFDLQSKYFIVNFYIKSRFNIYETMIIQFLDQIIHTINFNITENMKTIHHIFMESISS
jgi:hypothetical protein